MLALRCLGNGMHDAWIFLLKKADAWQRAMQEGADSNRPVIDRFLLPRKSKLPTAQGEPRGAAGTRLVQRCPQAPLTRMDVLVTPGP
jgi:hypothetical protein